MCRGGFEADVLAPALARGGGPARAPCGFITSGGAGAHARALGLVRAQAPAALACALRDCLSARGVGALQAAASARAAAGRPPAGTPQPIGPPILALARNPGSAHYRAVILEVVREGSF